MESGGVMSYVMAAVVCVGLFAIGAALVLRVIIGWYKQVRQQKRLESLKEAK
jgi:hypothetical protein